MRPSFSEEVLKIVGVLGLRHATTSVLSLTKYEGAVQRVDVLSQC
jgi:hypothetical protein